jgi:hypothetical protein
LLNSRSEQCLAEWLGPSRLYDSGTWQEARDTLALMKGEGGEVGMVEN